MLLLLIYSDFDNLNLIFIGIFKTQKSIINFSNGFIKTADFHKIIPKYNTVKKLIKIYKLNKNICKY
jgi:hypothetical protein